jgi:predicted DNA-binding protein (MmcQ/YjbR family)
MTVSPARVRALVAALADTAEGAHHGHPDFRVKKKIFATLSEDEARAAVRISSVEARALAARDTVTFRLVSDREPVAWLSMLLSGADEGEMEDLLEEAWRLRGGA